MESTVFPSGKSIPVWEFTDFLLMIFSVENVNLIEKKGVKILKEILIMKIILRILIVSAAKLATVNFPCRYVADYNLWQQICSVIRYRN